MRCASLLVFRRAVSTHVGRMHINDKCEQVDIIGQSNVPTEGPIIFTGNHANQFVDALQVSSPSLLLNRTL